MDAASAGRKSPVELAAHLGLGQSKASSRKSEGKNLGRNSGRDKMVEK